jgi:hypothetical protein
MLPSRPRPSTWRPLPEQGLDNLIDIEYFVDSELFHDPEAMNSEIKLDLYFDSTTKKYSFPIEGYQNF